MKLYLELCFFVLLSTVHNSKFQNLIKKLPLFYLPETIVLVLKDRKFLIFSLPKKKFPYPLKLRIHGILHYLRSADLSKAFLN